MVGKIQVDRERRADVSSNVVTRMQYQGRELLACYDLPCTAVPDLQ